MQFKQLVYSVKSILSKSQNFFGAGLDRGAREATVDEIGAREPRSDCNDPGLPHNRNEVMPMRSAT